MYSSPAKRNSSRPSTTFTKAHINYHSSTNLYASYSAGLNTSNNNSNNNHSTSSLITSSSSNGSSSRPHTPSLRRPASSVCLRSTTPKHGIRRPVTPSISSFFGQNSGSALQKDTIYSGKIKVSIRVKPLTSPKLQNNTQTFNSIDDSIVTINDQWTIDSDHHSISSKEVGEFTFDNVFHGHINNSQIFDASVKELVDQVMAGYNGTVFAYGMTGSGKTYSMQGSASNAGIIPLSVHTIFNHVRRSDHSINSYTIKVSYLEIYNEHLHDLLAPETPSEYIKLRDDPTRGVRALGLREVIVETPEELIAQIQNGDALRRTEGTEFNSQSSRSHAVVQISIETAPKKSRATTVTPSSSTLYLCDLAGSERAASQTERRKEGAYINKSLLTLGTVIARLSVASTNNSPTNVNNAGHIPYRDSKLTRLLQPALSGKSLVSVLCTVDLSNMNNNMETVSTLRFAARAKNITVTAKRNEEAIDPNSALIEKLMSQVESLKSENKVLRRSGQVINNGTPNHNALLSQIAQLEAENRILNERVEHLARLCDDNRLEQLIGFGSDESSSESPVQGQFNGNGMPIPSRPPSAMSHYSGITSSPDDSIEEYRRKENEYKSYIAHLEKQLYAQEVQKRSGSSNANGTGITINTAITTSSNEKSSPEVFSLPLPSPISTTGTFTLPPASPTLPTSPSFPTPQQYYGELVSELKEEIAELKESNSDKDRIISALRSINKRKENLSALSSSSTSSLSTTNSSSSSSINSPPSYHSPAYSRYYFSSTTSLNSTKSLAAIGNSTPKSSSNGSTLSLSSENNYDESTLTEIPVAL